MSKSQCSSNSSKLYCTFYNVLFKFLWKQYLVSIKLSQCFSRISLEFSICKFRIGSFQNIDFRWYVCLSQVQQLSVLFFSCLHLTLSKGSQNFPQAQRQQGSILAHSSTNDVEGLGRFSTTQISVMFSLLTKQKNRTGLEVINKTK